MEGAPDFIGPARRLAPTDFARLAAEAGLTEATLRAVVAVEAAGSGFDRQSRPKMLFEPHLFWRALPPARRAEAMAQALAYPKWGARPYPKDSYPVLQRALALDHRAALQSASWGLGQILGANHAAAGYTSAEAMVEAFCADEAHHLAAMIRFIAHKKLDKALRRQDWAAFARGYNGPAYAQHGYDKRLAAAYAQAAKAAPARA